MFRGVLKKGSVADHRDLPRVYRTPSSLPFGYFISVLITLCSGYIIFSEDLPIWQESIVAVSGLCASYFAYRIGVVPQVIVDRSGILVCNPFSTTFVRWCDFEFATADMLLDIERRDGAHVRAWGVQAANLTRIMGWTSFADRVADAINNHAAEAQGLASSGSRQGNVPAVRRLALWVILTITIVNVARIV